MKNFLQWCEERKYELPKFNEIPKEEEATSESGSSKRAVLRTHAYPPAAGRAQYPPGYFNPIAADNMVYNKDATK